MYVLLRRSTYYSPGCKRKYYVQLKPIRRFEKWVCGAFAPIELITLQYVKESVSCNLSPSVVCDNERVRFSDTAEDL